MTFYDNKIKQWAKLLKDSDAKLQGLIKRFGSQLPVFQPYQGLSTRQGMIGLFAYQGVFAYTKTKG